MSNTISWPTPYYPSLPNMTMPERMLDGLINNYGIRLGWMKNHVCACTYGYQIPGSPDPNCNTCYGRGYYWDNWTGLFTGLITFMHLSVSPDEPGVTMDPKWGVTQRGDPTLTIPYSASGVWMQSSLMDAYVEVDSVNRYNSVLVTGQNTILPYQQKLEVLNVYQFDPTTQITSPIPSSEYVVSGASVILTNAPDGTAYTVEYNAAPVYIAWREAGGMPHNRPFANGTGQIPKRFRLTTLDLWTRATANGSGSPQALP